MPAVLKLTLFGSLILTSCSSLPKSYFNSIINPDSPVIIVPGI